MEETPLPHNTESLELSHENSSHWILETVSQWG